MPRPFSGTAVRFNWEGRKGAPPYGFKLEFRPEAFDKWLDNQAGTVYGRAVLALDHTTSGLETLAATDNGTLSFDKTDDYLTFEGTLVTDGDDPGPSQAQRDIAALFAQKLLKQVSVGCDVYKRTWEFADEPDGWDKVDKLIVEEAVLYELSVVTYGAFRDQAVMRMESALQLGPSSPMTLAGGPLRLTTYDKNGERVTFDAEADKAAFRAERAAAAASADDGDPVLISASEVDSILTAHEQR